MSGNIICQGYNGTLWKIHAKNLWLSDHVSFSGAVFDEEKKRIWGRQIVSFRNLEALTKIIERLNSNKVLICCVDEAGDE